MPSKELMIKIAGFIFDMENAAVKIAGQCPPVSVPPGHPLFNQQASAEARCLADQKAPPAPAAPAPAAPAPAAAAPVAPAAPGGGFRTNQDAAPAGFQPGAGGVYKNRAAVRTNPQGQLINSAGQVVQGTAPANAR